MLNSLFWGNTENNGPRFCFRAASLPCISKWLSIFGETFIPMAKVICEAMIDDRPYSVPPHHQLYPFELNSRVEQIAKEMKPLAEFYQDFFPGDDVIRLTWIEQKMGSPTKIDLWSRTIRIDQLISAHTQYTPPPSPDEP